MALALLRVWPALRERLAPVTLGEFPTAVERLAVLESALGGAALYAKRDDLSSPFYGGNKVRTLEVLFGRAFARGAQSIVSTGAFGSNHAVATALHAPRVGLAPGALLFAQPRSWAALENLRVTIARTAWFRALPHWSCLPFAMLTARAPGRVIMAPGGATPDGALGYVSAALELGEQIAAGSMPAPSHVVVGVGSTCTSAGLLVGLIHAARLGLGFGRPATLVSVRVSPWPVTSRFRILSLAVRASKRLAELTGVPALALSKSELAPWLELEGRELGPGYGRPSARGVALAGQFAELGLFPLDTTYSSKSAAGFVRWAAQAPGPLLFWSTKSSVPLPEVTSRELERAPALALRWLRRAERELAAEGGLPPGYTRLEA